LVKSIVPPSSYVTAINIRNLANYDDWRVPTIEELEYLFKGSIHKDYFPHIQPDWYSSATPYSDDSFWCIYFTNGQRGHNKYGYGHLILVRLG
ncbi:DUF1566 domain-containing protein, partial [Thiotrichales bacterium HSG1]|nr:DUF1566 domain-containing protein [Thiotrichales bacterium HSG1]